MGLLESTKPSNLGVSIEFVVPGDVRFIQLVSSINDIMGQSFSSEPSMWSVPSDSSRASLVWSEEGKGFFSLTRGQMRLFLDWSEEPGWIASVLDTCNRIVVALTDGKISSVASVSLMIVRKFGDRSSPAEVLSRYIRPEHAEILGSREATLSWTSQKDAETRREVLINLGSECNEVSVEYTRRGLADPTAKGLRVLLQKWLDWSEFFAAVGC